MRKLSSVQSTGTALSALLAGALFLASPAQLMAGDLGGDCCADLEERISELEVATVRKGNRKVSLKLSGFVNRAMLFWDDGDRSDQYVVGGADDYSSRMSMKGSAKIGKGWSAGYLLEWSVYDTSVETVSQDNDDGSDEAEGLQLRHEAIYLNSARLGTFSMGHSSMATDGVSEIDLSGGDVVAYSLATDWVAGFQVTNTANVTWADFIGNIDGYRGDLVRYDSPNMGGFTLATSWGEDDYWDIALRYANEFGNAFRIAGAIGYRSDGESVTNTQIGEVESIHGSFSMLHITTGLNLTIAAGQQDDGNTEADFIYIKGGFKKRISSLGATVLYGEWGRYNDFGVQAGLDMSGSEVNVWGLGLVQNIDAAATELYIGFRQYSLDVDSATVSDGDNFNAVLAGMKMNF